MTNEEYGHHPPGYNPRGPDFPSDKPERPFAPADREQPCPVCGEVHDYLTTAHATSTQTPQP